MQKLSGFGDKETEKENTEETSEKVEPGEVKGGSSHVTTSTTTTTTPTTTANPCPESNVDKECPDDFFMLPGNTCKMCLRK